MPLESLEARPRGCGPLVPLSAVTAPSLRQQVFERVRAEGLIPRVDLARELGVSPASVTAITAELIDRGLIFEKATPRPTIDPLRGRPPVALGVRAKSGVVAGIRLSDLVHTAVILDYAGNRLAEAVMPSRALNQTLAEITETAAEILAQASRVAGVSTSDLAKIGVCLPGLVKTASGLVPWSPIITEDNLPLGPALSARFGRPVVIDNDTNSLTRAELWFGSGRARANFVVITIERGIGMGLVQNHRINRGAHGLGMEFGHTKVQLDGALCRCGKRGCLEAYVADYALVREAFTALNLDADGGEEQNVLDQLYREAKSGNATARAIFDRAGRYLAMSMANIVNLFDPELIILSGERMRYDFLYAEEVISEMASLTLSEARNPPRVEVNAWGDLVWAHGAAALALDQAVKAEMVADAGAAA